MAETGSFYAKSGVVRTVRTPRLSRLSVFCFFVGFTGLHTDIDLDGVLGLVDGLPFHNTGFSHNSRGIFLRFNQLVTDSHIPESLERKVQIASHQSGHLDILRTPAHCEQHIALVDHLYPGIGRLG